VDRRDRGIDAFRGALVAEDLSISAGGFVAGPNQSADLEVSAAAVNSALQRARAKLERLGRSTTR
jgi:hypothetical protein